MEKAIALDPGFAMAHRTMAWAYLHSFDLERSKHHIQKAFDLTLEQRDRVSEREFYLIQADYYGWTRKNWGKSIEVYQRLLEIYPDDFLGRVNLGDKYLAVEEWDKAIECYDPLTKHKDNDLGFERLARLYSLRGDFDKQKEVLEDWEKSFPDDPYLHGSVSVYYRDLRDLDKALETINKALAVDPDNFSFTIAKGYLYFVKGDLSKAQEEFSKLQKQGAELLRGLSVYTLIDLFTRQGQFQRAAQTAELLLGFVLQMNQEAFEAPIHLALAGLHFESGNMEAALKESEAALETVDEVVEVLAGILRPHLSSKMRIIYGKGLIKAEMGLVEEAMEAAERLKDLIEEDLNLKLMRFYNHLLGRVELAKENYPGAIEYFEEALSHIPPGGVRIAGHGRFTDSLALAYYRSGQLEKARDVYERNASLLGLMDSNVIFAKTFYMLGKVYEGLGNREKAIANFQKFLDLWKDADPGIVEVEDARKRLAGLKEK
jgi:tetratricopeptide (TPR) repeat protein